MLNILRKELESVGALNTTNLPPLLTLTADSLPKMEITDKMRLTVAQSEVMLYAGMFNRNMLLWDDSRIPINGISMVLSGSGSGKDKAAKGIRKCFEAGYNILNEKRLGLAKSAAISAAAAAGSDQPYHPDEYKPYYKEPEPLFSSSSSTVKGLHGHFNRLEAEGVGAGYVTSLEIGSALETGKDIHELIEFLSEVYDQGSKEVKLIGNKDEQLKPLYSFPVTALFGGSELNILYDSHIRNKFKMQFSTKLARRTTFNFNPDVPKIPDFSTASNPIEALKNFKSTMNIEAKNTRDMVSEAIVDVTKYQLPLIKQPLPISKEVEDLFNVYMEYNKLVAQSIPHMYPMSTLSRQHQQWRALKLAGALAIFACNEEVTLTDYVYAINFTELMSKDLELFEIELEKESYELFSDFIKSQAIEGKARMTIHELRKSGYLTTSSTKAKLQELVTNASSYDPNGIYTTCETGICYEAIQRTPINGISFKSIDTSTIAKLYAQDANKDAIREEKGRLARISHTGFEYAETTFEALGNMLKGSYAYTPFEFKDGIRDDNNIINPKIKWIAMDVDDSKLTASEMHIILSNINHHIVLGSDSTNDFKFRILLELDSFVSLEREQFKIFMRSVADDLHIKIDNVPRAQIYFSYSAEEVLSVIDAEPLETRAHILMALNQTTPKPKLTPTQAKEALKNTMSTFDYAYDAPTGEGTRSLIRLAFEANEMGASKEEIEAIIRDVNNFWINPMSEEKLKTTILPVLGRF